MKEPPPEIKLRQPAEVQWAHDLLSMLPECHAAAKRINRGDQTAMEITVDALCWVLNHDRGMRAEYLIHQAEAAMKETGNASEGDQRPG